MSRGVASPAVGGKKMGKESYLTIENESKSALKSVSEKEKSRGGPERSRKRQQMAKKH